MAQLGTYLAGTVPFAGDSLVESSLSSGGESTSQLLCGVAVNCALGATGVSGGAVFPVVDVCGVVGGAGEADGQCAGCVVVECASVEGEGLSGGALAPSLVVAEHMAGAGTSTGNATGYVRCQGIGIEVDFRAGGALPQIVFQ